MNFLALAIGQAFTFAAHPTKTFVKRSHNRAENKYGMLQWVAPKRNACSMYDQSMTVSVNG